MLFSTIQGHSPTDLAAGTDCKGMLDGLQSGLGAVLQPRMLQARTWTMISSRLDRSFEDAADRLILMPSHCPAAAIGKTLTSKGTPITPLMWRANRLVDILAKSAAQTAKLGRGPCEEWSQPLAI